MITKQFGNRAGAVFATMAVALTACSTDADPQASPSDDPTTSTSTEAPDWKPVAAEGAGLLPPGRYGLSDSTEVPWAVVEVPEGFRHFEGWAVLHEDPAGDSGLSYWTAVSRVPRDPCRNEGEALDVGTTVEDLAAAFQKQKLTEATAPTPVSLDGYQGLYLELQVPSDINFSECGRHFYLYGDGSGDRFEDGPGLERVWILDVDGDVVILDAHADADVPIAASETITGMVESVDFVARD